MFLDQLSPRIHSEYSVQRHSHLFIWINILERRTFLRDLYKIRVMFANFATSTYCCPVSKSSIERFCVWIEQIFNIGQTFDFKLLWLLLNDLPEIERKDISCYMTLTLLFKAYAVFCVFSDLWNAENRLLGLSSTGPNGSIVPLSLTQCR